VFRCNDLSAICTIRNTCGFCSACGDGSRSAVQTGRGIRERESGSSHDQQRQTKLCSGGTSESDLASDLDVASTTTALIFSGCCPVVFVVNELSYDIYHEFSSFLRLKALGSQSLLLTPPAITYLKPFVLDYPTYFLCSVACSRLHELQVFPCQHCLIRCDRSLAF